MATSKSKSTEAPATGNDIPKTSATSAVTTDLPQQAEQDPQAEQEVADTQSPAVKNGIGLVRVDGIDLRYVGIAPARDKGAKTPGGLAITQRGVPSEHSHQGPQIGRVLLPGRWCRLVGRVRAERQQAARVTIPGDGLQSGSLLTSGCGQRPSLHQVLLRGGAVGSSLGS
jgi:hypothetical protein